MAQVILKRQWVGMNPRRIGGRHDKTAGQMGQQKLLKGRQTGKRLAEKGRRPRRKGRLTPQKITAGRQNHRIRPRQLLYQILPSPIWQAQIDDHHIGPIGPQMRLRQFKRIRPPHPRARFLAHQPQRVRGETAVLNQQDCHPGQGQSAALWHGHARHGIHNRLT